MIRRYIALSLLLLNGALHADTVQRREPSLFLEYEREVTRTIETTQDENTNPFKKILAPITPKTPEPRVITLSEPITPSKPLEKPEIGNDALPYLVVNKPVSSSIEVAQSCQDTHVLVVAAEPEKTEEKSKKSLLENIHTVKDKMLARAKQFLGTPYGFGTKDRDSTDCSGFTQQVFNQFGIALPHSAAEQSQYGEKVSVKDLQVGDLLFFHTYKSGPSHVGIYAGDGKMIHASSANRRVQYDNIDQHYYKERFIFAKRIALNSHIDTSNE